MLVLDQLSRSFGQVTAVDRVSLEVPNGLMLGVIGRSGAGKSTLLRLINRLVEPSGGAVIYDGARVSELKGAAVRRWRARCAMIFQQFNLVGRLDVLTNVLIGRLGHHGTWSALAGRFAPLERAMAVEALDRLDMVPTALQRAETLSGGQQQRVAIARALVQEPDLILADEPIASLDPHNATRVMEALRAINREDGITVICNLHTLDTARRYCDRIVGMAEGRLVFDGRPAELGAQEVRRIYGVTDETELDEAVTSTDLGRRARAAFA
jgi:phosphonate transport system ATP-binding protein